MTKKFYLETFELSQFYPFHTTQKPCISIKMLATLNQKF